MESHLDVRHGWTTCVILVVAVFHSSVQKELSRRQIVDYLLDTDRYDSTIAPDFNKEYPTNVSVQMVISDVHSVSETNRAFSMDLILIQFWADRRLDFSSNDTIFKHLELDPSRIDNVWLPDTFFMNEKTASVHDVTKPNTLLHIHRNGTVVYSMRYFMNEKTTSSYGTSKPNTLYIHINGTAVSSMGIGMTLGCKMDFHIYPFDGQRCQILLRSFAYTLSNINFNWHGTHPVVLAHVKMNRFNMSNQVDLFDLDQQFWPMGTYSVLRADLRLRRNSGFYFLQVFVPSVLLVGLSWISFWIDPTAVSARVSLSVTCVLTMTTQSSGVRQNLPPVSYVKAIDVWMFFCLLYVFAALLVYAYVNVMIRHAQLAQQRQTEGDSRKTPDYKSRARLADRVSRVAFPASFLLFLVVFILVVSFLPQPADTDD